MTKDETLTLIRSVPQHTDSHGLCVDAIWTARSAWVLTRYGEFMALGQYPYLSRVAEWIASGEAWRLTTEELKHMETLVFHAAEEWQRQANEAAGWRPATRTALAPYIGQFVEYKRESIFGDDVVVCRVHERADGWPMFILKGHRTKGFFGGNDRLFRPIGAKEGPP